MSRRKRLRRRLIAVSAIMLVFLLLASAFLTHRSKVSEQTYADAREAGLAAYEEGDYAVALRHLSFYLSNNRKDVPALVAYAESRSRVATADDRHITEPIGLYHAALTVEPHNEKALAGVLLLYERTGRRVEWMSIADRLLELDPTHLEALRLKMIGYLIEGRHDEAEVYATRLTSLEPEEMTWRVYHMHILQRARKPQEEILALCDEWISEHDGDGRYHMLKANVLAIGGDRNAAREAAREAAHRGASSDDVLQQLLSLLDVLQMGSEAESLIAATQQQNPGEFWPHEAAVRRLWQHGRTDAALSMIDTLEQRNKQINPELLRWKSLLLILDGSFNDAESALAQLSRRADAHPENRDSIRAWVRAARARITLEEGTWLDALTAYNSALALDPHDPVIHFLMGEALARVYEHELAAEALERAVQSDPNWITAQMMHLDALLRIGRHHEAAHQAVSLLARSERPALRLHLLFLRAWLETDLSAHDLALVRRNASVPPTPREYLAALHEEHPDHPEVNELLVRACLQEGDQSAAASHLKAIVETECGQAELFLALAELSEHAGLGYEEQLVHRALECDGPTLDVAFAKARILHRNGRTEQGLSLLLRASEETVRSAKESGEALRPIRLQIERRLLEYRVVTGDPTAAQALQSYLKGAQTPESAAFALSLPLTWESPDLADSAISLLEKTVGRNSPRAATARATYILQHQSDDEAAIAHAMVLMNDVLRRTPQAVTALELMTALHLAGDSPQYTEAIRLLEQAIEVQPKRGDLYPKVIALLHHQGDFARASRYLDRMSSIEGLDADSLRIQIALYESQNDHHAIIARLSGRPRAAQSEAEALSLFSALHRTGRHGEAEQLLLELLDQPQPTVEVFAAAAEFYCNTGRVETAERLLETRLLNQNPGEAAALLGRLHQQCGSPDAAMHWLTVAAEEQRDNPRVWHQLASLHLEHGEFEKAKDATESGLEVAPDDTALLSTLAMITLNLGGAMRQRALDLLDQLDHDCEALVETLQIYDRIRSRDEQPTPTARDLRELRQLVRNHPGYLHAWRLAIVAHAEAGDFSRAVALARDALGRFPSQPLPAELATRTLVSKGQLDEALDMAFIWRSRSLERPTTADVVIAAIQLDLGRPTVAAAQLEPHVHHILAQRDLHPTHVSVLFRTLIQSGQSESAFEKFGPLLEEDDRWAWLLLELAHEWPEQRALSAIELASEKLSNSPPGKLAVASELATHGFRTGEASHMVRALHLADRAESEQPALHVEAMLLRASIAERLVNDAEAEAHYRTVLQSEPENWFALNNLAALLLRTGGSIDEALSLSERAIQVESERPELMNTHARALLNARRYDEAEQYVQRALDQDGRRAAFLLTLSEIWLEKGDQTRAHHWFLEAEAAKRERERLDPLLESMFAAVRQRMNAQ